MYSEKERSGDDYNVKKERVSANGACNDVIDSFWGLVSGTGRFYLGLAEASIEAMRTFNSELSDKCFGEDFNRHEYMENVHEKNAKMYEQLAENSRKAAERHRQQKEADSARPVEKIDYEKLARLVSEELRKNPL